MPENRLTAIELERIAGMRVRDALEVSARGFQQHKNSLPGNLRKFRPNKPVQPDRPGLCERPEE